MNPKRARRIEVPANPARVKGKLVESIVAAMHDAPGVSVRTNVRLQPLLGGRSREIDVLIEGLMVGYPFRIAIECKNERQQVGAPEIDAFVGKLAYIGIPSQQGIFVSVTGFTKGAAERARAAGLRTLTLLGLTEDRLRAVLYEVLQAIVHLLPVVLEWNVVNDVAKFETPSEMGCFFDENGQLAGTLMDLVWRAWHNREVPARIGDHDLTLRIPKGWHHVVGGKKSFPDQLAARVRVVGLVMTLRGTAEKYELVNAASGVTEKMRVRATFPDEQTVLHLGTFETEEALNAAIATQTAPITLTRRHRLPRVLINEILWPPSEQAWLRLAELTQPDAAGNLPPRGYVDVTSLEPRSFATLFEPVFVTEPLRHLLVADLT